MQLRSLSLTSQLGTDHAVLIFYGALFAILYEYERIYLFKLVNKLFRKLIPRNSPS